MRRSPLARGTARLSRVTRLKPVNARRKAKRQLEQFGPAAEYIRSRPCCICFAPGPSDPHHVRSRGAGGKSDCLVPICRRCHHSLHCYGRKTFEARWGVSLTELAAVYAEEFRAAQGAA